MNSNSRLRRDFDQAARRFQYALARHFLLSQKYSPDQPRIPAGNSDGGQWAGQQDPESILDDIAAGLGRIGSWTFSAPMLLAGGISKEDMGRTVQVFVSENCRGSINSVLPGQFLSMPIADVQTLAKSGNAAAKRCMKLLGRDDYRK